MDRYLGKQSQSVCDAVDDETAAYIVESRVYFEDLRQVSSQLAGLLVLAAAGSKSAGPHHPMLNAAEQLYREAVEGIQHARVTARAERHHRCLLLAAAALRSALSAAHSGLEIDPVLIPLRAAYDHLQRASNELPGFEMVAFDQACCGRRS
jgi:hypothetical protein